MRKIASLLTFCLLFSVQIARAIDANQFDELLGYTVVACTNATGDLEGADFDKPVKLDNGMVFEFQTYSYFYSYHPDIVVFAKSGQHEGKSVTQICDSLQARDWRRGRGF